MAGEREKRSQKEAKDKEMPRIDRSEHQRRRTEAEKRKKGGCNEEEESPNRERRGAGEREEKPKIGRGEREAEVSSREEELRPIRGRR